MTIETIAECLVRGERVLRDSGIDEPRLESELLLAHSLSIPRVRLHVVRGDAIDPASARHFAMLIERRCQREPSAYLLGHREFYSLDFLVGPGVLVPRPDTETLVDSALQFLRSRSSHEPPRVIDVGTGSGAIAIAIAVNLRTARVVALDRSVEALDYARRNAQRLGCADRVCFLAADLNDLSQVLRGGGGDLLVSNPPYVAADQVRDEIAHEPRLALVSNLGPFPKVYERLVAAARVVRPDGGFMVEVGLGQAATVVALLRESGEFEQVETVPDLAGIDRVVRAIKKS